MEFLLAILLTIGAVVAMACVYGLILAFPIMLLWNAVIPDILSLPEISFWQAFAICLLSVLLFGSNLSSSSK